MADTRLWYWRYTLRAKAELNSRSAAREFEGALIRDFGGGVGCVHPWTALGDASLDEQLAAIAAEKPTALGEQALLCAEADGLSRRQGRNLFTSLTIPPSHWTAGTNPEDDDPVAIEEAGFWSVKLKGGSEPIQELVERLGRWKTEAPELRYRVDFNETLNEESIREFWLLLDDATRAAIDFVEDPCPWNPEVWHRLREELGLPIAADREVMQRSAEADWLIVKPAVINAIEPGEHAFHSGQRLAFTSYMDHPIGQLYAAWRAAECSAIFGAQLGDCGLLTHHLFEPDPFFEQLGNDGPILLPPEGTGLGFDDLLDSLPWKPLI